MYYPRGYEMLTNGIQTTVWRPMKSRETRSFLALTNNDVSSKAIVASLIIDHTVNFALSGNSHGPCNRRKKIIVICAGTICLVKFGAAMGRL